MRSECQRARLRKLTPSSRASSTGRMYSPVMIGASTFSVCEFPEFWLVSLPICLVCMARECHSRHPLGMFDFGEKRIADNFR